MALTPVLFSQITSNADIMFDVENQILEPFTVFSVYLISSYLVFIKVVFEPDSFHKYYTEDLKDVGVEVHAISSMNI